jgi:adenylate kinase
MNIIILGPQGSGKGTQADLISKKLNLFHLETGEILRERAKRDARIKNLINSGSMIPDEEMIDYIDEYLTSLNAGYDNIVFDGCPRSIKQYILIKKWLSEKGKSIDKLIYLDISDEEALRRISSRRTCSLCGKVYNLITNPAPFGKCSCGGKLVQREDDKKEVVEKRLLLFHQETEPILTLAQKDGILVKVDGERPIEIIFQDILSKI